MMAQMLIHDPYTRRMDSIAMSRLCFISPVLKDNSGVMGLINRKYFKLTIKTNINGSVTNTFINTGVDGAGDSNDYMAMGKYDIRGKFYITRKFRFVIRMVSSSLVSTGVKGFGYTYMGGIMYKFP
jgi:hypothetical protein